RSAERETQEKGQMILRTLDSARQVIDDQITAETNGHAMPTDSSGHISQQIVKKYHSEFTELPYRFRQVASNPANPNNMPDEREARILAAFEKGPGIRYFEEEGTFRRMPCRVIAVPVVMNQERCFKCHTTPPAAVAGR